jgi:hypothetical protein
MYRICSIKSKNGRHGLSGRFFFFILFVSACLLRASAVPSVREQRLFSPMEGQIVEVTPPPFRWEPVKNADTYMLQVSTDKNFSDPKTQTYRKLKRPVFVLTKPLLPGQWYWRVGVPLHEEIQEKIEFGRVRTFTVPPRARHFPFPDWDVILPRIPQTRPRLFFPGKSLDRMRQWAVTDLKPAMDRLETSCQKEVGKALVPEPGMPPKKPDFGPWAIEVMKTTRPPMDQMENCALAYILLGNRQLGLEAKRRLLHFFSWDPNGPTSLFSYDEPAMWMMMRGIRTYDWTYDLYTPEERTRLEAVMKARAVQFLERLQQLPFESNPYNSHAGRILGFLGECALGFIHEWPEAKDWLDYVTLLYYSSFPAWGSDDGGWQEGPYYWRAYMRFALLYIMALQKAAGIDLKEKPFFRNAPYYALYTASPYHQYIPFGDGQTGNPITLGPVMYAFSTLTRNPYFRWYAEELEAAPGDELLTLASYDPSLKARSPLEIPQGRSFRDVGLVSLHTALGDRERDISFLMRSSPYGSVSHGHADQNAFVIEAFGRGLALATGYYPWYNSPHHNQWTRATQSVNSILVDGCGQAQRSWDAYGFITAFEVTEGYDYAEAEAAPAYMGRLQRFRRHVVHIRPGIFIIFDDLQAPQPVRYQWLLHTSHRIDIDEKLRVLRIQSPPAAMRVHLLLPTDPEFSQTGKYSPEPESEPGSWENTWHFTAGTITPSPEMHFLAVLLVHRQEEEGSLPQVEFLPGNGALGVQLITSEGNRDIVIFRTDRQAGVVKCGGIESTARVLARGTDKNGHLLRRFTYPHQ